MDFKSNCWQLRQFQICEVLSEDQMSNICNSLVMKHFKKGVKIKLSKRMIFNDVYFLKSGTIKIVNLSSYGEETIKYVIKGGDIFGILSLMGMERANDYAVTMEDSSIFIIDSDNLKRMMVENQKLSNYFFELAGLKIKKLERNLASLHCYDAKTRIVDFIKYYVEEMGVEKGDFLVAKILLSNSDIGNITSTSRQTVNKILNSLRRNNIIDFDNNTIQINKEAIKKLHSNGQITF